MKSNVAKKLGNNIKRFRIKKGMSQGDICRELGIDSSYMSNIEAGKKNPTLANIERIAEALGVKISDLVK